MQTRSEHGEPISPVRLLEMLEFRFGAFEVIACASLELARERKTTTKACPKPRASTHAP